MGTGGAGWKSIQNEAYQVGELLARNLESADSTWGSSIFTSCHQKPAPHWGQRPAISGYTWLQ